MLNAISKYLTFDPYFGIDPDILAEADKIDPDQIPDENLSPDTQALLDKADEVNADIICDWYHQFTLRNDDCELINASMRWPLNEAAPDKVVNLSRQIAAHAYQETTDLGHTTWDTYPGGTAANIVRNAHDVRGGGSVLFEFRGQAPDLGNAANGRLVTVINTIMTEILERLASAKLYDIDPDAADDIPLCGDYFWKALPRSECGPEH